MPERTAGALACRRGRATKGMTLLRRSEGRGSEDAGKGGADHMKTESGDRGQPILRVRKLVKHFPITGGLLRTRIGAVRGVDSVDLDLHAGETLGVVGESGCGKTTLGRTILRLLDPTSGSIEFKGRAITPLTRNKLRPLRQNMQFMFQHPFSSLARKSVVEGTSVSVRVDHGGSRLINKKTNTQ